MLMFSVKRFKSEEFDSKKKEIKKGKLPTSHRYNRIPLLCSHPGGLPGAGCVGLAHCKVTIILESPKYLSTSSI